MLRMGLRQGFRAPRKLAAYFLVTLLVCSFLAIGLNLKQAADSNMEAVLSGFNVMAMPDFKGYIDENGHLAPTLRESVGYFPCFAENYDIEKLRSLAGVQKLDARNQFGACVNNKNGALYTMRISSQQSLRYQQMDVFIFELACSHPITITGWLRGNWKMPSGNTATIIATQISLPVKILWSATGRTDLNQVTVSNPSNYVYHLVPGKTYIMNLGEFGGLDDDIYHRASPIGVTARGSYRTLQPYEVEWTESPYPPIAEYYDGFWDTPMGRYYQQSAQACDLAGNSLTAITTSDLSMIPAWSNGYITLKNGRLFTQEDYDQGNRVCLISQDLLERMDWEIGDTLDLSFYETAYTLSFSVKNQFSTFYPYLYDSLEDVSSGMATTLPRDHVFDENTFTIIGTYDGNVYWREEHDSDFQRSMHWLMMLVPESAVQNQPTPKLSPYHTTLRIEPLMVQKFLAAAQSSGLMEEQEYGYQMGLTVDDHGLSKMVAGLESLQQISRLTLVLSVVTAGLAVLVLAIVHLLQSRRQVAAMRSLGMRRAPAAMCLLVGILLAGLLGAAAGGAIGGALSARVTQRIVDTAQEESLDASFSAAAVTSGDGEDDFQLNAAADPRQSWLAAGSVFGALVILAGALFLREAGKPPLLLLGVKE